MDAHYYVAAFPFQYAAVGASIAAAAFGGVTTLQLGRATGIRNGERGSVRALFISAWSQDSEIAYMGKIAFLDLAAALTIIVLVGLALHEGPSTNEILLLIIATIVQAYWALIAYKLSRDTLDPQRADNNAQHPGARLSSRNDFQGAVAASSTEEKPTMPQKQDLTRQERARLVTKLVTKGMRHYKMARPKIGPKPDGKYIVISVKTGAYAQSNDAAELKRFIESLDRDDSLWMTRIAN